MLSLIQSISALQYGVNHGLYDPERRPDYLTLTWALVDKGHELDQIDEAIEAARRLVGNAKSFCEESFQTDIRSYNPAIKSRLGTIVKEVTAKGWKAPRLTGKEGRQKSEQEYENGDMLKPSPYFVGRKGRLNPIGAVVTESGKTLVPLYDFQDDHKGYLQAYPDAKEKSGFHKGYTLGTEGSEAIYSNQNGDVTKYDPETREWVFLPGTSTVYLTESISNVQAIEDAMRDEARGDQLDTRLAVLIACLSANKIVKIVERLRGERPDLEIVCVMDREQSGAGLRAVAEASRKVPGLLVVDPLDSDADSDIDDYQRKHGSRATIQLLDSARVMTADEIEEALQKSGDNVVQMAEERQNRQKASPGRVGGKAQPVAALAAFDGGADQADIDELPVLVRGSIEGLASELGLKGGASELCARIEFDFAKFHAVEGAMAFQQKDRRHQIITERGEFRTLSPKEVGLGVRLALGHFYHDEKLTELLERCTSGGKEAAVFIKSRQSVIHDALSLHILNNRQFVDMAVEVSMFDAVAKSTIKDGRLCVSIPHVPFDESIGSDIQEDERERIVADYRQHWSQIDEFVALLVACRFAAARKKAYLWLRAPSDWGKGLLCAVLDRLGLITDLTTQEVERLGSGQPVGLQVGDFLRSWCLCFNEFRSAKTELKTLEQSARFSPKGLPQVTVLLYLKLFTSAEHVESLGSTSSGAEDQFCNRFSLIEPEGGRIDDRPLFRENRGRYLDALAGYLARELNRQVAEYVALGQREASARADAFVTDFHSRHGLGNRFTRLSEKVPELCEEFLEWLVLNWAEGRAKVNDSLQGLKSLTRHERLLYEHGLTKDEPCEEGYKLTKVLYVRSPQKLLKEWLESEFNRAEAGKLVWKGADFTKCLPEVTRVRFGGSAVKVMRVGCYGPTWG